MVWSGVARDPPHPSFGDSDEPEVSSPILVLLSSRKQKRSALQFLVPPLKELKLPPLAASELFSIWAWTG